MDSIIMFLVMAVGFFFLIKREARRKEMNTSSENKTPSWIEEDISEKTIAVGKKSFTSTALELVFWGALVCSLFLIGMGFRVNDLEVAITGFIFLAPALILGILHFSFSKTEIFVTSHRIHGVARFGKRVDLPIDSITAVGTSAFHGIDVSTSSGSIRFKFIENNDAVHSAISKLLNNRQTKTATPVAQNSINTPASDADELKKYKELLDSGVISQEEFDAKKKQLLGL